MSMDFHVQHPWRWQMAATGDAQVARQSPPAQALTYAMSLTLAQTNLSTCEISDALIKFGVPHGGHIPDIHRISPHSSTEGSADIRLCGPAYTVRMVLASERDAPKLPQGAHFVDLAPEGSVAFVSAPPGWSPCPRPVVHTPVPQLATSPRRPLRSTPPPD